MLFCIGQIDFSSTQARILCTSEEIAEKRRIAKERLKNRKKLKMIK